MRITNETRIAITPIGVDHVRPVVGDLAWLPGSNLSELSQAYAGANRELHPTVCPRCGGDPHAPFTECLLCEAIAQAVNRCVAQATDAPLPIHRQALADRLADDARDDRAA